MEDKKIVNFFFEVLSLKLEPRSGWHKIGIKNPESVAEHIFCATQIAYFLAVLEKADVLKTVLMTLFHDNGETRIGDFDLIQKCYLDSKKPTTEAFLNQIKDLPQETGLKEIHLEYLAGETKEAKIVCDADKLELALQAKIYLEQGHRTAKLWIENIEDVLETKSAKELLETIEKTGFNEWWQEIDKIKKRISKLKN